MPTEAHYYPTLGFKGSTIRARESCGDLACEAILPIARVTQVDFDM